jgi:hypothetical protein
MTIRRTLAGIAQVTFAAGALALPASAQEAQPAGSSFFREAAAASLGALAASATQFAISQIPSVGEEPIPYPSVSGMGATVGYRLETGGSFTPREIASDRRAVIGSVFGVVLGTALVSRAYGDRGVDIPLQVLTSVAQGTGAALVARLVR